MQNKKLRVSTGWVKAQSVGKFSKEQEVLVYLSGALKKGKIEEISEGTGWLTIAITGSEKVMAKPEDLRRLVVTDGTRFAPLQHEDWDQALSEDLADSEKQIKYVIIERHKKDGVSLIRLARLFKPRNEERDRKIAKEAYSAGFADAQAELTMGTKRSFDDYWREKEAETQENLIESH